MRVFFSFLVLLLIAFPAAAQEVETVCAANIPSDALTLLEGIADLQPEEALARVIDVRAALQRIELECARAGVVVLDQPYTTPDERFTLQLPRGWFAAIYNPTAAGGVLFVGSSPTASRLLQTEQPRAIASEIALQVVVGLPPESANTTLETVMRDFRTPINALYSDLSTTLFYEVDERPLAWFAYRGEGFDGVVVGASLDDGRFVVVRGVAAGGYLDGLTIIAEAVALSVR